MADVGAALFGDPDHDFLREVLRLDPIADTAKEERHQRGVTMPLRVSMTSSAIAQLNLLRPTRLRRSTVDIPHRRLSVSAANRNRQPTASAANEMWSMDFVSDALFDGRRLRALTVVDAFTHTKRPIFRNSTSRMSA